MNKFPDQNPNPVLRVSSDGSVEYANPASGLVCEAIGAGVGEKVPTEFFDQMSKIASSGSSDTIEVTSERRTFALLIIGVFEFSFINIYGTEITDALALEEAHRDNEILLLNILPASIADRLKSGEGLIADRFDEITVLFADVVDFRRMASRMGAEEVVKLLNDIFTMFDELAEKYDLEKIKTIGDAYMVVGGLGGHAEAHAERTAEMGMDMLRVLKEHSERTGVVINVRVGMHSGPVVAGVVGIKKFIYDVCGETVNTASRMESHGVPGRIQVVDSTRARLVDDYEFEERGIVDVKGIGKVQTHLLIGRR
jgi:class 3 adenylate cyclase